jgi:OOP family OmpA-OmpF porin
MKGLLTLGIVGLAVLVALCPSCRAPAIEDDITEKATGCAADLGLPPELIQVSGRDVSLIGFVPSQAAGAELAACIAGQSGVRTVDNQLRQFTVGVLNFQTRYDDITIAGLVPSLEKRVAILEEARALWGADRVEDELIIEPGTTIGGWTDDSFAAFLRALHHSRRDLGIELTGGRAIISGTVLSELARARVLGGAAATLPEFGIVDRLTLREPSDDREVLQANLDRLLAGEVVEFAIDSTELTARGRAVLDEVVAILQTRPGRVEISGHTDSTGAPEHNTELSLQRANSAARYLAAKGIDAARLETIGHGANRPVATNATAEGRQANRRTEFHSIKEN